MRATLSSVFFVAAACIVTGTAAQIQANLDLDAVVLVGDTTCPAIIENNVNVNTFAVVSLNEQATVSADLGLTTAEVDVQADVLACLCVRAGVSVADIPVDATITAQAIANIRAAADIGVGLVFDILRSILGSNPLIQVELTPTGAQQCGACPSDSFPSCAGGQCLCLPCPAGSTFNPATGSCTLTPSALARSGAGSRKRSPVYAARQANREQIMKRFTKDA